MRLTALVLLAIGPSMAINAAPTEDPATGNFYEVVAAGSITWSNAKLAAEGMFHNGVKGHLATITSQAEFEFVDQLRQDAEFVNPQVWIGGSQSPSQEEPGDGWMWENGEGEIPGTNNHLTRFAKWANGEPNDAGGDLGEDGSEQHLALGRYPSTGEFANPGFNDEGSVSLIGGYIVEFSGTVPAETCAEPGGCNPSGVVTYAIDEDTVGAGNTVSAFLVRPNPKSAADLLVCPGEFAYRDPRVSVDTSGIPTPTRQLRSLDVFLDLGGTDPDGTPLAPGALILDRNTFGSPCFAVVKGTTNGFEIETGTVLGTQLAEDVPGIGNVFSCNRTQGDLQKRTQYTFQTTIRSEMRERGAAAMTSACENPTSGTTKSKSFDVLNTHESCGIDYAAPGGRLAVRTCFYLLANGKFYLADRVLVASKGAQSITQFNALRNKLLQAWSLHATGQYEASWLKLEELLALLDVAIFAAGTGIDNYQGDLIMRTNNLLFRLEELIQAQTVP